MNFAEAVKGRITRSTKLETIRSAAQTEFGRDITGNEETLLLGKFGLNDIYVKFKKVII